MWAAGSGTLARDTFRFPIKARSLSTTHTLEPSSNTHGRDSSVGNDVLASKKRQLWLGMSPAGSQWPGMAKSLMSIPVFAKSINISAAILEEVSVDVKRSILDEKSNFADIVHSIDGIMAVEIALVDVLYHLGLQPDRIVGLSLGEFGCGYADGAISARQALLGLHHAISAAAKKHHGQQAMAVVCLSRDQVIKRCPDGVFVAIDGGHSVVVVGGSKGAAELFMEALQEDGVTAILVDTGDVAFHTPLIGDCRGEASTAMRPILRELKQRSPRWLSSTIPFDDWTQESSHNLTMNISSRQYSKRLIFLKLYRSYRRTPLWSRLDQILYY
ncbi:Fatty acid synthase [Halotydeus destructor]|nr:Fatty acid synthase [Halotydeus destructor]